MPTFSSKSRNLLLYVFRELVIILSSMMQKYLYISFVIYVKRIYFDVTMQDTKISLYTLVRWSHRWKSIINSVYTILRYTYVLSPILSTLYLYRKSKGGDLSQEWPEGSLFSSYYKRCRGGFYSIPLIAPLYPWSLPYNVRQGSIKYHFLSLWYDLTWYWIPVSWTIGEHFTH